MANLVNLFGDPRADFLGDSRTVQTAQLSIRSATTDAPALYVGKSILSSPTVAPIQLSANSTASAPVLEFVEKGFVSITSVVLTTVANTDYAIRVKLGNVYRWIPCFLDAGLVGTATF